MVINSPIFWITALRFIGWAPHRSSNLGRVDTEAMWVSRRSSRTESEDDRVRDNEIVYLDNDDASDGDDWNVCRFGGSPSRIILPRISVLLYNRFQYSVRDDGN
jgi:hypothetical protein